jgi:hypothetical protein
MRSGAPAGRARPGSRSTRSSTIPLAIPLSHRHPQGLRSSTYPGRQPAGAPSRPRPMLSVLATGSSSRSAKGTLERGAAGTAAGRPAACQTHQALETYHDVLSSSLQVAPFVRPGCYSAVVQLVQQPLSIVSRLSSSSASDIGKTCRSGRARSPVARTDRTIPRSGVLRERHGRTPRADGLSCSQSSGPAARPVRSGSFMPPRIVEPLQRALIFGSPWAPPRTGRADRVRGAEV